MMRVIFHIARREQWTCAKQSGVYGSDTVGTEGFLHASLPRQVIRVANRLFRGRKGLVLLWIDPEKVQSQIRYEAAADGEEYPHIYGPLNADAVVQALDFEPEADGTFSLPAEAGGGAHAARKARAEAPPDVPAIRMRIRYATSCSGITKDRLVGFFEGWPDPPSPGTHLRLLQDSDKIVLAIDEETSDVVGFITALSDGVLSAYIPLLEVRRPWRGQGIGRKLVRRMLAELEGLYMVDLLCDPGLEPFYAECGMRPAHGMMIRNRQRQRGRNPGPPTG